jgi:hypothetical protein
MDQGHQLLFVVTLCLKFHPVDKAYAIADCSEKKFTAHGICDAKDERQTEATLQALLEAAAMIPLKEWDHATYRHE